MILSGGRVTAVRAPSFTRIRAMWNGPSSCDLSGAARYSPSGDQSSWRPTASRRMGYTSAILAWVPPATFATKTAVAPRPVRSHAIRVPSGDHTGLRSSAGSVVNLRTEPSSRDCTYKIRVLPVFSTPNVDQLLSVRREGRLALGARHAGDGNDLRLGRSRRPAANLRSKSAPPRPAGSTAARIAAVDRFRDNRLTTRCMRPVLACTGRESM